mmetsp:Transcript_28707/g.68064  ORF Transcript_28707/g.68064 Transcript_28707/m.68064 type:complete len:230 (-) Transcript_28707:249-938(-)
MLPDPHVERWFRADGVRVCGEPAGSARGYRQAYGAQAATDRRGDCKTVQLCPGCRDKEQQLWSGCEHCGRGEGEEGGESWIPVEETNDGVGKCACGEANHEGVERDGQGRERHRVPSLPRHRQHAFDESADRRAGGDSVRGRDVRAECHSLARVPVQAAARQVRDPDFPLQCHRRRGNLPGRSQQRLESGADDPESAGGCAGDDAQPQHRRCAASVDRRAHDRAQAAWG